MSAGVLDRARRDSAGGAVLLYAGSCPRCRFLARLILALSAGRMTGVALSEPEWRAFYAHELPESRGSPVLVRNGKPYWGLRVFPLTLWMAIRGAFGGGG